MSAYLVNDQHIDILISYAIRRQYGSAPYFWFNEEANYITDETARELGQELVNENYRSLAARYGDKDQPHEYRFKRYYDHKYLNPVQVLKLCDGYVYQACESGKDFYNSKAYALIEFIRHRAIRNLPGYEEAEWTL